MTPTETSENEPETEIDECDNCGITRPIAPNDLCLACQDLEDVTVDDVRDGIRGQDRLETDGGRCVSGSYQLPDGEEWEVWKCSRCESVFSVASGVVPEPWKCPYCARKTIQKIGTEAAEDKQLVKSEIDSDRSLDTDKDQDDLVTDGGRIEIPDGKALVKKWGRWGPPQDGVYHTDPTCRHLDRIETVEVELEDVEADLDECKWCAGTADTSGGDHAHYQSLIEARDQRDEQDGHGELVTDGGLDRPGPAEWAEAIDLGRMRCEADGCDGVDLEDVDTIDEALERWNEHVRDNHRDRDPDFPRDRDRVEAAVKLLDHVLGAGVDDAARADLEAARESARHGLDVLDREGSR